MSLREYKPRHKFLADNNIQCLYAKLELVYYQYTNYQYTNYQYIISVYIELQIINWPA